MDDHIAVTIGLEEIDPGSVKVPSTFVVEGSYGAFGRSIRRREEVPRRLPGLGYERGHVLLELQVERLSEECLDVVGAPPVKWVPQTGWGRGEKRAHHAEHRA